MNKEERAVISYRMKRAKEAFDEAKILFDSGHINSYVNRLYYACFYTVSALLLCKGTPTSRHSYLRSVLHRDFVKTGLIDQELGKHFDLLFDSRQEGDYADFVEFDANEVADWLDRTKEFVDHVDTIICNLLETTGK